MSRDIEIVSGTATSVDSDTLRDVAWRMRLRADDITAIIAVLQQADWSASGIDQYALRPDTSALHPLMHEIRDAITELESDLDGVATLYELTELAVQRSLPGVNADAVDAKAAALIAANPGIARSALGLLRSGRAGGGLRYHESLLSEDELWPIMVDAGRMPGWHATPLQPSNGLSTAELFLTSRPHSGRAPTSLEDLASRVPNEGRSRIRVERYDVSEGDRRFIVYITGTKLNLVDLLNKFPIVDALGIVPKRTLPGRGNDPEEWNMEANVALYTGHESATFELVEEALQQAGYEPGDRLWASTHSQGAMIGEGLVADSDHRLETHIAFGPPVNRRKAEGVQYIEFRHDDDLVRRLSATSPVNNGSPDSFAVTGNAEGVFLFFKPHSMNQYIKSARTADATGDPRVEATHRKLEEFTGGANAEIYEFGANPDTKK